MRLIGVEISLQTWINAPFYDLEGGIEAWWEAIFDGAIEVVAEDQVVP